MLKKVLKCIAEGNSSISDIADTLEMDESAVMTAIEELRKLGYLKAKSHCTMDKPACRDCPIAASMQNMGMNLCISEKGMAYLKKN
jgi:predicted transcriptional regulator